MSKKPFFSVVLPTRNRAELLPSAIISVLKQTFEDFELIISDNFSSDETSQIAKSFNDERVRYVRSEKPLSIGDSLEFGLSHAKGEFISFLSDDDAYSKVFLERFNQVINKENAEIVSCNLLPYYSVDTFKYGKNIKKGTLIIFPYDREVISLDKTNSVSALFASVKLVEGVSKWNFIGFPQLVNSTYHNSIIKKAQARISKLFPVLCNDIYTAALFLNISNKYCYVDEPLYLHRNWEGSETTGYQNIFEKYPSEKIFDYVPLKKLHSSTNYIANLILKAKSDWGEDYADIQINWNFYFNTCYQQLMYFNSQGTDISEQLDELKTVFGDTFQNGSLTSKSASKKDWLKSFLRDNFVGKKLLRLKYRQVKFIDSSNEGFEDIEKSAESLGETFLEKYSSRQDGYKTSNHWGEVRFQKLSEIK